MHPQNPLELARAPIMHLIRVHFSTGAGANSPKARSSSPSPLSLILRILSLHLFTQIVPTSHPPLSPPVSLTGRMLSVRLPGRYWPEQLSLVYRLGLAPAHSQYSSPPTGQLSLCTPPPANLSKAQSCTSQFVTIHPLQFNVIQNKVEKPCTL